jgi:hypothetical protein
VLLDHLRHLDDQERGLLANARCLGEGVDVPALDGVAFIDPRRSEVDIVQAVGRAIRLAEDKKVGTIVIPVFIEPDGDPDSALDASAFKPVWDVIRALRAHDDALAEQLDELRRQLGRQNQKLRRPAKIHLDVPARIGTDFVDAFNVHLVDQTTANWEFWFGLLQRFAEREGHARVPASHVEDVYRLGQWVNGQRTAYSNGQLDSDRVARLEAVTGWAWSERTEWWEEGFGYLCRFAEREGHARVPADYLEEGFRLGGWLVVQRTTYKTGKLAADRVTRLEALPNWTWHPFVDQWEDVFGYLCRFVEREGHSRVPFLHVEESYRLGQWVSEQRSVHAKGKLLADRVARLEALPGWIWNTRAALWEEGFGYLCRFVEREGHARVTKDYEGEGYQLGQWVNGQRTAHARGRLADDRVARLEALPHWTWNPTVDQWKKGFKYLCRFSEREGHGRVAALHVEGLPTRAVGEGAADDLQDRAARR